MTTTNGLPPVSIPTTLPSAPTTTAATTATTATAPAAATTTTGLEAATTAGPLPAATTLPPALGAGVSTLAARLGQALATPSAKAPLLELRPGVVADAVSVTAVVKQLANGPQAAAVVEQLVGAMQQQVGIAPPPALVAAAKANPERIVDLLALTTGQMKAGFDALHAQHRVRTQTTATTTATTTKTRQLPQHTKTQALDTVAIKRPDGALKELAPGLWQGDVKNDKLDDAAAKKNLVLAEILDRLSTNPGAAKADVFSVEHNGGRFTSLDGFLDALVKDGHTVEAVITHRVADFCALKTKAPDGSIVDVPAAVLVKTGVKDAAGNEAVVPGVHSEVVFRVRSSATTKGPKLDGDVKWYQGVPNTGFFACDLMRKSTWTGSVEVAKLDQTQALQAAKLAAVLGDVIQDVSAAQGLAMSGYGVTGVCNDSVAIVQQAMTGNVTGYPLFMRDDVLLPEIDKRLRDPNRRDDAALKTLKAAIGAVPSDDKASTSAKARALASIPWAAGSEPFASVQDARTILSAP